MLDLAECWLKVGPFRVLGTRGMECAGISIDVVIMELRAWATLILESDLMTNATLSLDGGVLAGVEEAKDKLALRFLTHTQ